MFQWFMTHSPLLYFTQSLWRDEVFSILAAQKPLGEILPKLSFEPPVYYTILHFWIKLFGTGELATRALSFVGFSLATVIVILWAEKLFNKHWLSWFTPVFFFFNPMLLFYAFEVRTYGWYIFFATLSLFSYFQRQWILLSFAMILGFYTHSYFLIVPLTFVIHWSLTHKKELTSPTGLFREPFVISMILFTLAIIPWLIKISRELSTLKNTWYYPVDLNLVTSVLGNMFIGYEGTPWYLWNFTKILSVILCFFFILALKKKSSLPRNLLFFLLIVIPLTLVIGISFVKPLFVNRYVIPVTIGEIFLIILSIDAVKSETIKKILAGAVLLFSLFINVWYPPLHAKLNIRETMQEVNGLAKPTDLILAQSSLIFFETYYYSTNKKNVFLYNPSDSTFPWYVGSAVFRNNQMIRELPAYPQRAFLIHEDGTFDLVYRIAMLTMQKTLSPPSRTLRK